MANDRSGNMVSQHDSGSRNEFLGWDAIQVKYEMIHNWLTLGNELELNFNSWTGPVWVFVYNFYIEIIWTTISPIHYFLKRSKYDSKRLSHYSTRTIQFYIFIVKTFYYNLFRIQSKLSITKNVLDKQRKDRFILNMRKRHKENMKYMYADIILLYSHKTIDKYDNKKTNI